MSKNNTSEYLKRMAKQKQRFGLRKLTIGVASVLLSTAFMISGVNADSDVANNQQSVSDQAQADEVTAGIQNISKKVILGQTKDNSSAKTAVVNNTQGLTQNNQVVTTTEDVSKVNGTDNDQQITSQSTISSKISNNQATNADDATVKSSSDNSVKQAEKVKINLRLVDSDNADAILGNTSVTKEDGSLLTKNELTSLLPVKQLIDQSYYLASAEYGWQGIKDSAGNSVPNSNGSLGGAGLPIISALNNKTLLIEFKHNQVTVYGYPNYQTHYQPQDISVNQADLQRTFTRTLVFHFQDGKTKTITQYYSLAGDKPISQMVYRDATLDKTTNQVTYGNWYAPLDSSNNSVSYDMHFAKVNLDDYLAKNEVAHYKDSDKTISTIDDQTLSAAFNLDDPTKTDERVDLYVDDEQLVTLTLRFIDGDENNKLLETTQVTGKVGTDIYDQLAPLYQKYIDENYGVADSEDDPLGIIVHAINTPEGVNLTDDSNNFPLNYSYNYWTYPQTVSLKSDQTYTIKLCHAFWTIYGAPFLNGGQAPKLDHGVTKDELQGQVTRTVTFHYQDGTTRKYVQYPSEDDQKTAYRTVHIDKVTGEKKFSNWYYLPKDNVPDDDFNFSPIDMDTFTEYAPNDDAYEGTNKNSTSEIDGGIVIFRTDTNVAYDLYVGQSFFNFKYEDALTHKPLRYVSFDEDLTNNQGVWKYGVNPNAADYTLGTDFNQKYCQPIAPIPGYQFTGALIDGTEVQGTKTAVQALAKLTNKKNHNIMMEYTPLSPIVVQIVDKNNQTNGAPTVLLSLTIPTTGALPESPAGIEKIAEKDGVTGGQIYQTTVDNIKIPGYQYSGEHSENVTGRVGQLQKSMADQNPIVVTYYYQVIPGQESIAAYSRKPSSGNEGMMSANLSGRYGWNTANPYQNWDLPSAIQAHEQANSISYFGSINAEGGYASAAANHIALAFTDLRPVTVNYYDMVTGKKIDEQLEIKKTRSVSNGNNTDSTVIINPSATDNSWQSVQKFFKGYTFDHVTRADYDDHHNQPELTRGDFENKPQVVNYYYYSNHVAYNVHYVDVTNSGKIGNYVPADGTELVDHEVKDIQGNIGESPDATAQIWNFSPNYVAVQSPSKDMLGKTKLTREMGDVNNQNQDQWVYLKHAVEKITAITDVKNMPKGQDGKLAIKPDSLKKEAIRKVHFVTDSNQPLLDDQLQKVVFNGSVYVDKVNGQLTGVEKVKDADDNVAIVATDKPAAPTWIAKADDNSTVDKDGHASLNTVTGPLVITNGKVHGTWTTKDRADKLLVAAPIGIASEWQSDLPDATLIYTKDVDAQIRYVDDTTRKVLIDWTSDADAHGKPGDSINFSTNPQDQINVFKKLGYVLVRNDFKNNPKYKDGDNKFEVHFIHDVQGPEEPALQSRIIKYFDAQTGKEIATSVIQTVSWKQTKVTDKVTGKVLGYNLTGDKDKNDRLKIETTDPNKAWVTTSNDKTYASVVSPDLTKLGYKKVPSFDQKDDQENAASVAEKNADPCETGGEVDIYYFHNEVAVDPKQPVYSQNVQEKKSTEISQSRIIKYYDDKNGNPETGGGLLASKGAKTVKQTLTWFRVPVYDAVDGTFLGFAQLDAIGNAKKTSNGDYAFLKVKDENDPATWTPVLLTQNGQQRPWSKNEYPAVTSPDLSKLGYRKEQAKIQHTGDTEGEIVAQTTANPTVAGQNRNIFYVHDSIPVFPSDKPTYPAKAKDKKNTQIMQTRTIHYYDDKTGAKISDDVVQTITWSRTAVYDKVDGSFLGYLGRAGKVDSTLTDDNSWIVTSANNTYPEVASPDLTARGYKLIPSLVQHDDNQSGAKVSASPGKPTEVGQDVSVYYFRVARPSTSQIPTGPGTSPSPTDPSRPNTPQIPMRPGKSPSSTDLSTSSTPTSPTSSSIPSVPTNSTNSTTPVMLAKSSNSRAEVVTDLSKHVTTNVSTGGLGQQALASQAFNKQQSPQTQSQLPQTGNKQFGDEIIGLASIMVTSIITLAGLKRRRKD